MTAYPSDALSVQLPTLKSGPVSVAGWIYRVRHIGGLTFVVIRDGQGLMQVRHDDADAPLPGLEPEMAVRVSGVLVADPRAPGGVEIREPAFRVLAESESPLPFHLGAPALEAGLDLRLNYRTLSLRHPAARPVFHLEAALAQGFRNCLNAQHFTEVWTPKLLGTASESGANVFSVQYFDREAYLAQSPQFYKQMLVAAFGRVFEIGPVFRAEPHDTARHLSQYTSMDMEMGFIEDHHTVMAVLRDVVAFMLETARPESAVDWPKVPDTIPAVHFADALDLVSEGLGEDVRHEPDLAPAHEQWLGEWAKSRYGSDFLFVEGYPMQKRPFYTTPDPARPLYSNSFDLLFRGQEIVTGGQRLHRYQDYLNALDNRGLSRAGLEGYLDAFRYGMPPHGGFAIGLERLASRLMGLSNIRDAALFPRDLKRLEP